MGFLDFIFGIFDGGGSSGVSSVVSSLAQGASEVLTGTAIGIADAQRQGRMFGRMKETTESFNELPATIERQTATLPEQAIPAILTTVGADASGTAVDGLKAVDQAHIVLTAVQNAPETTEEQKKRAEEQQKKLNIVAAPLATLKEIKGAPTDAQKAKLGTEMAAVKKVNYLEINAKPSNAGDMIAWAIEEFIRNLIELIKALINLIMFLKDKWDNRLGAKEPSSTMEIAPTTDRPQLETNTPGPEVKTEPELESNEAEKATLTEQDVFVPPDGGMGTATVELGAEEPAPEPEKEEMKAENEGGKIEEPAAGAQALENNESSVSADTPDVPVENTGPAQVEPQSEAEASKPEETAPAVEPQIPEPVAAVPEQPTVQEPVVPQPSASTPQRPRGDAHDITIYLNSFLNQKKFGSDQIKLFNDFVSNSDNAAAIQGALQQEGVQAIVDGLLKNNPELNPFIPIPTPVEGPAPVVAAESVHRAETPAPQEQTIEAKVDATVEKTAEQKEKVELGSNAEQNEEEAFAALEAAEQQVQKEVEQERKGLRN